MHYLFKIYNKKINKISIIIVQQRNNKNKLNLNVDSVIYIFI